MIPYLKIKTDNRSKSVIKSIQQQYAGKNEDTLNGAYNLLDPINDSIPRKNGPILYKPQKRGEIQDISNTISQEESHNNSESFTKIYKNVNNQENSDFSKYQEYPESHDTQESLDISGYPDFIIKQEDESPIYAIGDIHGDIIPLIICLRDCCKVIKKYGFNPLEKDEELNNLMATENMTNFDNTLGYLWCGGKAKVVFCGDLLDNVRKETATKPGEFPFEEAKILLFINSINNQAMIQGGRLYKVLGNHDLKNLVNSDPDNHNYKKYISKHARDHDMYKRTSENGKITRYNYFFPGNDGAKLIGKNGAFLFLMINDFIFVHGSINIKDLNKNNMQYINKNLIDYINKKESFLNIHYLVLDRSFGFKPSYDDDDDYADEYYNEKDMCSALYEKFEEFNKSINDINDKNDKKMKLVIGHCTQTQKKWKSLYGNVFTKQITNNNISIEYGEEVEKKTGKDAIYGITVSCGDRDDNNDVNLNKPSIYRVDVAMSRAFDKPDKPNYDKSRTPQVLKIVYKDGVPTVSIIKSTDDNTEIHLLKNKWVNESTSQLHGGSLTMHQKYQKYKLKYIKLKNEMNNIKKNI